MIRVEGLVPAVHQFPTVAPSVVLPSGHTSIEIIGPIADSAERRVSALAMDSSIVTHDLTGLPN